MKCLILVGGYGTRLRPLTLYTPKSLVPFCNMPIVEHQIAAAVKAGVTHVILAVGYQPEQMRAPLASMEKKYGITITCSVETTPLGTAGPLNLAREILQTDPEPFFVFNSDVICEFPLIEMLNFHKQHGGQATICATKVTDPSKYGVIVTDPTNRRVQSFVEKPQIFVGDEINAGLYVLSKSVLDRVQPRFMMLEKDVFPQMAQEGLISCFALEGYWADIGQPKDYLAGMRMHLEGLRGRKHQAHKADGPIIACSCCMLANTEFLKDVKIVEPVLVHPSAVIEPGCVIGPHVWVGEGVKVSAGARIKDAALFPGALIDSHSFINGAVIGWGSKVGKWSRVCGLAVLAEDVEIGDEVVINGALILPHKTVKTDVSLPGTIIM